MKKTIAVILACGVILTGAVTAWAQVLCHEATGVTGKGEFESCVFDVRARLTSLPSITRDWVGAGSFKDKEYPLKAHLTIKSGECDDDDTVVFSGTARVFTDMKFLGAYDFKLTLFRSTRASTPDWVNLIIYHSDFQYEAEGDLISGYIGFSSFGIPIYH